MARDEKIWIDGNVVDQGEAKISVFDHGLLYGDGVFEGIRAYGGKIFEEEAHLARLFESARSLRLDVPYSAEELSKVMVDLMKTNGLSDAYLRLVVTRGVGDLGLDPRKCPKPSVFCIASTITLYPQEMYEKGMKVIVASHCKNHPNATPPRVKSLNYLNSVLGKIEANDAGCPEAIMLNHLGFVAECTADNVFLVKDGTVLTPPTEAGILKGVTRDVVMRLCGEHDVPVREANLVRHDLYVADECFLTGTAAEVIGVTSIDGRTIGTGEPGPVTRRLKEAFHAYARRSSS
jgi:branched-chain amino acid aminotransferase